ncbi:uncharacterized protein LOC127921875 isoform X2 [Oncorhynchus keta]|nr:uncharacterized protein LOC127921875 isoform X2 [Oncorhynchus keta]
MAQIFWERLWMILWRAEYWTDARCTDSMLTLPRDLQNHHLHLGLQHRRDGESATAARREGSGTEAQVATAAGILFPICRGAESVSQLDSSVSSLTSIILWNTKA